MKAKWLGRGGAILSKVAGKDFTNKVTLDLRYKGGREGRSPGQVAEWGGLPLATHKFLQSSVHPTPLSLVPPDG